MSGGMEFDSSDFDEKMRRLEEETIPKKIERGLGRAALQLLNDTVMQSPTVPVREGWLRGSGSIFVNNKLFAESPHGKQKFANKEFKEHLEKDEQVAVVGFNVPYAARTHNVAMKFREPSAGNKYLTRKLQMNKDLYLAIIAGELKEGEGGVE